MTLSRRPACTPRCPLPIPSSASQAATAAGAPEGRPCQGPGWRRGPALRPGPPQSPGAPAAWALSWVGRRQRQARQAQRRRLLWTKLRPPRPGGGGGGEKPHRAARVPGTGQCGTGPQRGQQNRDPSRGADGDVPEPRRPLPAQLAAPGNGGGTHMAAMGCEDPALSVRPSLPALVALQLPRSRPSLRPAGPHLLRSRGSRTRGGAHGSLRPSGKGAGRSPAESTSSWRGGTLEYRRAVGVLSVRDRRECSGFLGTAHKGGPIPSHADPQTGCSRKTGLSALFSDSVGSRDFSGPPICDRLKHPGAATAGLDQGILGRRRGGPEA